MIQAVLFDFIGTTVKETFPELINDCFERAFSQHGIPVDPAEIKKNRGKDKRTIIENILNRRQLSSSLKDQIYSSFKENILENISAFRESEGATEVFLFLVKRGIKNCIGTGLERDVFETIFRHLHWNKSLFDYIGIANETGRGRPHPDMIHDMMKKLNLSNPNEILKLGDTTADIQEGKNANVFTGAILSGTQSREALVAEKPDFILNSLSDLKKILTEEQPTI